MRRHSMRRAGPCAAGAGKVQASVARCLRTPPYAARRKGLVSATRAAYAARAIAGARLSFATVRFGPITVVPHRDKANLFRRSSILFRPRTPETNGWNGGAAGYRPRVRAAYSTRVYVHSPVTEAGETYAAAHGISSGRLRGVSGAGTGRVGRELCKSDVETGAGLACGGLINPFK